MKFAHQRAIDKEAQKRTEELRGHLQDVSHKIKNDQDDWLDGVMKDILPPRLYESGKREELTEEIEAYLKQHGFSLVFVPDSLGIRLMRHGNVHAEFRTGFKIDGEPVQFQLSGITPNSPSNN